MKKVVCMFSGEWILKHRGDDPMPVSKLNIFLSERFADRYFVDKDTYSILEFSLDVANVTVAQICAIILPFLQRNYDDFEEKFSMRKCATHPTESIRAQVRRRMWTFSEW